MALFDNRPRDHSVDAAPTRSGQVNTDIAGGDDHGHA